MVVTILAPVARRGAPATAIAQVADLRPGVVDGIRWSAGADRAGLDGDDFARVLA